VAQWHRAGDTRLAGQNLSRVLDSTVVVIGGRTGERLSSQALASRMRYGVGRFSSALALYVAMMQGAMGEWLETITAAFDLLP
jgi:hypothetical protein